MDGNYIQNAESNIFLFDRKRAELEGVADVSGLSDTSVFLNGKYGMIEIDGADLKILSFSSDTGKLILTGRIDCIIYYDDAKDSGRRRLFGKK